jgi:hypothetical protein
MNSDLFLISPPGLTCLFFHPKKAFSGTNSNQLGAAEKLSHSNTRGLQIALKAVP